MTTKVKLQPILKRNQDGFTPIMPYAESKSDVSWIDLSKDNLALTTIEFDNTHAVNDFLRKELEARKANFVWGGYDEHRVWYQRSSLFGSDRCIHLGIDIWAEPHTPVFSPMAGKVHSFQDNAGFGNYGPTIILEHELEGEKFYTLYGHLSRASLVGLSEGKPISKGEKIAELGEEEENGNWSAHIHFQLMTDMQDNHGDFPGVCSPLERDAFLEICLDPNLILGFGE